MLGRGRTRMLTILTRIHSACDTMKCRRRLPEVQYYETQVQRTIMMCESGHFKYLQVRL